jgi:predicted nucleotidyltransferase
MQSLERELLLTLFYTAQFQYPLTTAELILRKVQLGSQKFSSQAIKQVVATLITNQKVAERDGYLFISGTADALELRAARKAATEKKLLELQPLVQFLNQLPGVSGVALTGSAALDNAGEDDDIDLMIITENNRLWLIRPLVILFAYVYGKRRSWQKEEKNSWCFNLWLERKSMAQPRKTHSLYIAYEVCQTKWLLDVDDCRRSFFKQNVWVQKYLPTYYQVKAQKKAWHRKTALVTYLPVISEVLTLSNYILYILQRLYMRSHMTRERVGLHFAFFHPRDTQRMISQGLHAIVEKLKQ